MQKFKVIRTSTVPLSLNVLLKGQLAFLSKHFQVIAVSGNGKDLEEVSDREQVPSSPVEMKRKISPIQDLCSLWNLYCLFRREKPHIVHSITPKAGLLSMTAAYFARVPVRIHTFTGLIFPSRSGLMQKLLITTDRILCRFATNVYPEGQGVKKDLLRYNITNKPLKVLANGNVNGIDINYFNLENFGHEQNRQLKEKLGISENDFVFIFVGRLVGDKGINELVSAFKKMQSQKQFKKAAKDLSIANVETNTYQRIPKLLLVGPLEDEEDPLKSSTLKEIKKNPHIISVGYQKDVRPYLAISNCLTFPSYREGFPNVVIEAGAMELPCIVTDINGSNEIIMDRKNGLIIPAKDPVSLYLAMYRMMNETELYHHLRENSRQMIICRYQKDLVWEAILQEYKSLIKNVPIEINETHSRLSNFLISLNR